MSFLTTLESTSFAAWLRESNTIWAYPTVLTLHTVGLALLVGASAALDLRLLGFAPRIPVAALSKSFRVMWFGFWLNLASGMLLLVGYPTKALTNPVFYLKIALIALALWTYRMTSRSVFVDGGMLK